MRNTSSLYYPFLESILSVLPLVDEFIIAMGDNNENDTTEIEIKKLESSKIKIVHTVWDLDKFQHGSIYAQQTNIAKKHCTGDWLIYIQSDEVIHEKYYASITRNFEKYFHDRSIEGFLFAFKHFYGDYNHIIKNHAWYAHEIRVIRNLPDIHSFGDAQSFRFIKNFNEENFRQNDSGRPLQVALIQAEIYHYGWVRPPHMMLSKTKNMKSHYHSPNSQELRNLATEEYYDYGNMNLCSLFDGKHPTIMESFIAKFNWSHLLHFEKSYTPMRALVKHEKIKYRLLSWIENNLLNGKRIFGYRNWYIKKVSDN